MKIPDGVITISSPFSVKETIDRLQAHLLGKGAVIYTRIDQQKEVEKTGIQIRPLEFLLFGNPRMGGPLMAENSMIALDLPLKVIAWEEASGNTNVSYNDPEYMAQRYSLSAKAKGLFDISKAISGAMG